MYTECPVLECEEKAEMQCEQCNLSFCKSLHGSHNSHICQLWKSTYKFPDGWEAPLQQEVVSRSSGKKRKPEQSRVALAEVISVTSPTKPPLQVEDCDVIELNIKSTAGQQPSHNASIGGSGKKSKPSRVAFQDVAAVTISEPTRGGEHQHSFHSNETSTKEGEIAQKIREILQKGGDSSGTLTKLLQYGPYDVEFLSKVSNILQIDISPDVNARRPTREGVMKSLIAKLVDKTRRI